MLNFRTQPSAYSEAGKSRGTAHKRRLGYGAATRLRRYLGIDIAEEAIRRAASRRDERTEFRRADAAELQVDGRFDIVVFNECLYYFPDPIGLLRSYERLLNDGGVFVVSMHGVERTEFLWDMLAPLYRCEDGVRVVHECGKSWTVKVLRSAQG
jgi:SAM-dependent methyltransferase